MNKIRDSQSRVKGPAAKEDNKMKSEIIANSPEGTQQ